MSYQPKVSITQKYTQNGEEHLVIPALLKFIKAKDPEAEDLWYNPTLNQYWVEPYPNLEVYYADDFYQVQPILISEKEPIEIGDLVYHKQMFNGIGATGIYKAVEKRANEDFKFIYLEDPSIFYYATRSPKILALPEHFYLFQLQDLLDGEIKEGEKVFVKCYQNKRTEEYFIHHTYPEMTDEHHITLFTTQPSLEDQAQWYYDNMIHNSCSTQHEEEISLKSFKAGWKAKNNYKGE